MNEISDDSVPNGQSGRRYDHQRQPAAGFGNTTGAAASPVNGAQRTAMPQYDSAPRFPAGTTYGSSGRSAGPVAPPSAPRPISQPWQPPPTAPPVQRTSAAGWAGAPQQPSHLVPPAPLQPPHNFTPGVAPSPVSTDRAAQWLAAPGHLKLVAGGIGGLIAVILFLSGGPGGKIAALVVAAAVWVICFRHGYHERAGLQAQTPIPADDAARIAVEVANTLRGPLSRIEVNGSTSDRADFTVRGTTWSPLEFHAIFTSDPSGATLVSTHLDSWTSSRIRINFIPVPFTKSMDGYGLYRSFGDRLLGELQRRDGATNGAFRTKLL